MEYFIIAPGYVMDMLYPILAERGENGVIIRIIYDDIGCKKSKNGKLIKNLTKIPNCKVVEYQPLGLNLNMLVNYRDHRKMTIIDNRIVYSGGDNLADEYVNKKNKYGFWRDNCAKYEGNVANTFSLMFAEMWYTSAKEKLNLDTSYFISNKESCYNGGYLIPFNDGPMYDSTPAYNLILSMIANAKESIYISTPYFIVDDALIHLLSLKCSEGIDVKILIPGIPDKKAPYLMAHEMFRDILKSSGKVYEMTKGFNHAKNYIIDGKYAMIGTINMDYRSLFLHYECGVLIINNDEIAKMKNDFESTVSESKLITFEIWKKRPLIKKLIAKILNIFAPMF